MCWQRVWATQTYKMEEAHRVHLSKIFKCRSHHGLNICIPFTSIKATTIKIEMYILVYKYFQQSKLEEV